MKYMGSKRWMLQNGLGKLLASKIKKANRFVDLFTGSGAVAIHVAQKFSIPVEAYDLQKYSAVLADAVIGRNSELSGEKIWSQWYLEASKDALALKAPSSKKITKAIVMGLRSWCEKQNEMPFTKAYGGHYFSPEQTLWIDSFRKNLPTSSLEKAVTLAALIRSASRCAAAPGHTAQPFQLTRRSKKFIVAAWNKDLSSLVKEELFNLVKCHAKEIGSAEVCDANKACEGLRAGDLVFIDPPYSGVHYSRFYHVLEAIARGKVGDVSGAGRYPELSLRPKSQYSLKTDSYNALDDLFKKVAEKKAKAIVTFPDHECSNGLSGEDVRILARKYFKMKEKSVVSKFSTLGGTNGSLKNKRSPRQNATELILTLTPKIQIKKRKKGCIHV